MNRITSLTKRYPIAAFFILTFILSFGFGGIANVIYNTTQSILLTLPFALLGTGPLLAALIVSAMIGGKAGVVALLRKFTIWRAGLRWYVIAFLLQPVLNLVAIYLNVLLGAPAPSVSSFGSWSALLGTFVIRLIDPFSGPVQEELGWRGFAQPRLQQRYSPLTANLILAVLVTIWHFQYIPTGGYEWINIPGTIAVTIIYGWVYNATGGSMLLPFLMHVVEPLINANFIGVYQTQYIMLRVSIFALTAVIVALLAGKNLGRKETTPIEADFESATAPA
jgi:membrane protease YdiL (CAAX protease family)